MKSYLLLLFILCFGFGFSQNHSDCETAQPFCSATGEGEPTVSPGSGNVINETRLSCVDNENFSTWYEFTVEEDGIFNFTLNPINQKDDYDWALFNITGSGCADIPNDPSLLVSCNSWGDFDINGPTGISTAKGGNGISNGPGTTNGPPFNADLLVKKGETYKLMVSNWSQSTKGFNINVAASTAKGIYAESHFETSNVEICKGQQVTLQADFTGQVLGDLTFSWAPAQFLVDPNVEQPVLKDTLQSTTNFVVTVMNGPCKITSNLKVFVGTIDYEKENKNKQSCIGQPFNLGIDFTGVLLPSGLKYHWTPENLLDVPTKAKPTTVPLFDTTMFYFEIKNGPCYAYDSMFVYMVYDTVNANFEIDFDDDLSTIPIETNFINLSDGDKTNIWTFGDSTGTFNERSLWHNFDGYDRYEVKLITLSESGVCIDSMIKIIQFPEVIYPNIITPNADEINDVLWITGVKVGSSLAIFNRWGKRVYFSENYLHDWSGSDLPSGIYYYEFVSPEGNQIKGWLQLTR